MRSSSISRALRGALLVLSAALALPSGGRGETPPAAPEVDPSLAGEEASLEAWDLEGAERSVAAVERAHPGTASALAARGRILFYQGRYDDSLAKLKAAETLPGGGDVELKGFEAFVAGTAEATRGFSEKEGEHFRVRWKPGRDGVLADYALETLEAARREIGKDLGYVPPEKVLVEFYPSQEAFVRASSLTAKEVETSGTIALCKFNRILVTTPRVLLRGYLWRDTLNHEFVHYVLTRKTRNRVPLWLHEGIAKYEEVRWRSDHGSDLLPIQEALLAEALKGGSLISFASMYPSIAKLKSQHDAALAFAEVRTAIADLVADHGFEALQHLIGAYAEGKSDDEAFRAAVGESMAGFEASWRKRLAGEHLEERPGLALVEQRFKEKLPAGTEAKKAEESMELEGVGSETGRQFLVLGDLLRDRMRLRAALAEYRKARKALGSSTPVVFTKLGLAHLLLKEPSEADRVLTEGVRSYPDFASLWPLLGEARLEAGDRAGARTAFENSISINPFDPRPHERLEGIYRQEGRKDLEDREARAIRVLVSG